MTRFVRLGASCAFVASAIVALVGGCEAIVSNDVPAYTCSSTPYAPPRAGAQSACPIGMYCEGAGCVACQTKDICDGFDNDCNGIIDDGAISDHDGDGYTVCGVVDPQTGAHQNADCDDSDPNIHPGAAEVCNGKDDDCNGIIDDPGVACPNGQTCVPSSGQCIANEQACSPANCPAPKVCDPQTQQCVLPSSQDAGTTGCTSNEQCTTGICAGTGELGAGQQPVCTQPCCTSSDCAQGYVCFGAGTGGNYCISAESAGRSAPGGGAPGASCGRGADCRSGVCSGTKCEDTCCSDASCTNGTSCAVTTFGATTTLACVPPTGPTGAYQSGCNGNSDCASGYCQSYHNGLGETVKVCIPPCCSSQQCGSYMGATQFLCYDDYVPPSTTNGPVVPVCDYPQPSDGPNKGSAGSNVGNPCTSNSTCFSNHCLIFNAGKFCSDVCCIDADCGKAGWVCRPTPQGSGTYLRCVPQGG